MRTEPIFIVGYMHSGTTLLLNVLGNHADIYCPEHETKYFMHLDLVRRHIAASPDDPDIATESFVYGLIKNGFPLSANPPAGTTDLSDSAAAAAFRRAMDATAARHDRKRWAEKTPAHIFQATQIASLMPDARFVEIVRDPRDVLASKKTRTETVWSSQRYPPAVRARKHLEKSFDPLWDSLSWVSAVEAGDDGLRLGHDRWMRIRYEDLVAGPDAIVSELCRFAGLAFTPDLLGVTRGIPADPDELDSEERGVVGGSVGRWTRVLDPVEVDICQRVCHQRMKALGYPVTGDSRPGAAVAHIIVRSVPELGIRLLHRWRLGGRAYLLAILRSYARRIRGLLASRR